jgi:hypothetical protein
MATGNTTKALKDEVLCKILGAEKMYIKTGTKR